MYSTTMVGVLVVKHIAIGAGVLQFDSWVGQMGHSVASAATFLWSSVALSRGDERRHSLYASA